MLKLLKSLSRVLSNMSNISNEIKISHNSNMDSLKLLLSTDNSPNKPKIIQRSGEPTKKFLKWNLEKLKQGETTFYADSTKYYDPIKQNIKKIPKDKRYKAFTAKQSFLAKNVKVDSSYAPKSFFNDIKSKSKEFSFERGQGLADNALGFLAKKELSSNLLLKILIDENKISGNYRIIIKGSVDGVLIDQNYIIGKNFWKDHLTDFQVDSESMIWNTDQLALQTITFIFTEEKKLNYKFFDQAFLDGVGHCFFTPIISHFESMIANSKSKSTIKKYETLLNKVKGKKMKTGFKTGLIQKYANGIKSSQIGSVCEELQIEVVIEQPFDSNPLFQYRSNKKPLKRFKFLNTRSDHVEYASNKDLVKSYEPIKLSQSQMIKMKDEMETKKSFYTFTKNSYGISTIKTLDNYYVLDDKFYDAVSDFEDNNRALKNCGIDSLKHPELQSFIDAGTHFNGTIDFQDISEFANNQNIPSDMNHIDMTKAYTRFEDCKQYSGFLGNITDFREVDNYKQKGLYRIDDLDFSKCSDKFKHLNNTLSWFLNNNIYTDAELTALKQQKACFAVTHGAFGSRFDMKLTDEMINEKTLVKHFDSGHDLKIPYYCKYFGMISMTGTTKNFYMNGDEEYFKSMNSENCQIYFENETAKIVFNKKECFNKKHITAQITAYQRLIMLEQLLEMDLDKVVRVCVDGIYYKNHDVNLSKTFSYKTKMTFRNSAAEEYLSSIISETSNEFYELPSAKSRDFYKSELYDGEGGLGKTYYNIFIDNGLIDVCYIPHSWKLATAVSKQYAFETNDCSPLQTAVHFHVFNKEQCGYNVLEKHSVILIDECSMLTNDQKEYIIENTAGKVIFMGDIDMQLCQYGCEQMNKDGINKITRLTKNWRFKDDKMIALNNILRANGSEKYIDYFNLGIKTITKSELKKQYKADDMILNYYKENEYAEMFKDVEKFKITSNTRDYKNGEIVFDKNIKVAKEFRHGYTIHSVQGETFKKNIYIDIRSNKNNKVLKQNRLFYTAVSRANYFEQLYLIVDDTFEKSETKRGTPTTSGIVSDLKPKKITTPPRSYINIIMVDSLDNYDEPDFVNDDF